MPKHGIDRVFIRRTPMSVLGTVGGPSWAQALVSPRMKLHTFPSAYAILKNTIMRRKYDAFAWHPMVHVSPYMESTVTAWTCPIVIRKIVFLPFRLQILSAAYFAIFVLLHILSKHYSVWFMTPCLCNSSPISQKGGMAVLCPVAILGTFTY